MGGGQRMHALYRFKLSATLLFQNPWMLICAQEGTSPLLSGNCVKLLLVLFGGRNGPPGHLVQYLVEKAIPELQEGASTKTNQTQVSWL